MKLLKTKFLIGLEKALLFQKKTIVFGAISLMLLAVFLNGCATTGQATGGIADTVTGNLVVEGDLKVPHGGICIDGDGTCAPPGRSGLRVGRFGIHGTDSSGFNLYLVPTKEGKVGIGTGINAITPCQDDPSCILEVDGGIKASGTICDGSDNCIGSGGSSNIPTGDMTGDYSVALGYETEASGEYSIAMGKRTKTTSTGYASTAMGKGTEASGYASTAMGSSTASGSYSTAMGVSTEAIGDSSTAMGSSTKAQGERSTAMGYETEARGYTSTAIGSQTTAHGIVSTAMGRSTTAWGEYSTAMGYFTQAMGDYSTAIGYQIRVDGKGSVGIALGHEGLFDVEVEDNDVMVIMGGKVGIDTVSPGEALEVNGKIKVTGLEGNGNYLCIDNDGVLYRRENRCS